MTAPPRPRDLPRRGEFLLAVALWGVVCALALVRATLMKDWTQPLAAAAGVALLAVLCALWVYGLWRRLNWLRWTTVLVGAFGCLFSPLFVAPLHQPLNIALYWLQVSVTLPATLLLARPGADHWYRGRN